MLRFRSVRTRSLLFALATLVVIALSVLLAWGWSHYQDGLQSKRATVVEINNRIKTLGKRAATALSKVPGCLPIVAHAVTSAIGTGVQSRQSSAQMMANRTATPTPRLWVPHVDGQSSPLEASTIKAGGAANRAAHFRVGALGSSLMPSFHVHSRATGPNHWIHA